MSRKHKCISVWVAGSQPKHLGLLGWERTYLPSSLLQPEVWNFASFKVTATTSCKGPPYRYVKITPKMEEEALLGVPRLSGCWESQLIINTGFLHGEMWSETPVLSPISWDKCLDVPRPVSVK